MNLPSRFFPKHLLIVIILLSAISTSFAQKINRFDNTILRCAEGCRTPKANAFFTFISTINNPVCLTGPAALLISGIARSNTIQKKKALFGVESISGAEALVFSMKFTIGRIRPSRLDSTFTSVVNVQNKAFPSGHTAEAFAMATAMSIAVPKWYVVVPAYAWASMIAYARVYLGVHYPTDVIGGAVVGSGTTFLMYKLNKWLQVNDKGHHPLNEILGTVAGLGTAFLIYKTNDWIRKARLRKSAKK